MGINVSNNASKEAINLRYSAFLGMMYVSTPESEAAIKDAKAEVGESEVKKGFTGNKGDGSSAKSLASLAAKGVKPVTLTGFLTSAQVIMREHEGRSSPYLNVGIKDEDRFYLSVDLSNAAAQMLARKLVNARVGELTELRLFATYDAKEGAKAYANHGCTLKQGGAEVQGINPSEQLIPLKEEAKAKLAEAGVDDKETVGKRLSKVELDYHISLMDKVNAKFTAFYERKQQQQQEKVPA
jgi:hypothetical protein